MHACFIIFTVILFVLLYFLLVGVKELISQVVSPSEFGERKYDCCFFLIVESTKQSYIWKDAYVLVSPRRNI